MSGDAPHPLQHHYDGLWDEAAPAVRAGRLALDPWARRKDEDGRRGLTLLARVDGRAADALAAVTDRLHALEPEQYYQPRGDLHLTVLSLFTATTGFAPFLERRAGYEAAIGEVARATPSFAVALRGVTLSTGAVLATGFPLDDTLATMRDRLRAALAARDLGETLDRRYRIVTAHVTLARFVAPLRDPAAFVEAVGAARREPFGAQGVGRVELVLGDWYHTHARERVLARWALPARLPGGAAP